MTGDAYVDQKWLTYFFIRGTQWAPPVEFFLYNHAQLGFLLGRGRHMKIPLGLREGRVLPCGGLPFSVSAAEHIALLIELG